MKFPPHIEVVGGDLERETSKEGVWCVRGRWVKHSGEGHNGSEGDGEKNVLGPFARNETDETLPWRSPSSLLGIFYLAGVWPITFKATPTFINTCNAFVKRQAHGFFSLNGLDGLTGSLFSNFDWNQTFFNPKLLLKPYFDRTRFWQNNTFSRTHFWVLQFFLLFQHLLRSNYLSIT